MPPEPVICIAAKPNITASTASTPIGASITGGDSWTWEFSALSWPKKTTYRALAMYIALRKAAIRAKAKR